MSCFIQRELNLISEVLKSRDFPALLEEGREKVRRVVDFEDGGRDHEPRNAGGLQKLQRKENRFCPHTLEGLQPCQCFDLGLPTSRAKR